LVRRDDAGRPLPPYRAGVATNDQAGGVTRAGASRRRWPVPGGRLAPWWPDIAVAAAVAVVQVGFTALAAMHQPERRSLDALAVLLLLAGPAGLVVLRRRPEVSLAVAFGATLAYWISDYPRGPVFPALIIALFTAVLRGRRAWAWGSLAAGYLGFAWLPPLVTDRPWPTLAQALGLAAWLLVLGTVAEITRSRRERGAELERTRTEEARRRASEERVRIARELHDVLAHNISLINVQAGVALHLLDERPEQARPALAAIKDASKDALGELRAVLDILRQGEDVPRAPEAGLRDLDGLVERTRAAGVDVAVRVEGAQRPVPTGVDLAAFRIAQEALTNVVRHAGASHATIRLAYGDNDLLVQVDDDGRGAATAGVDGRDGGAGKGLDGMRERVSALGGRFDAGPRPGRGFRVRARLPIGEAV
jgi:signal transduction histidine kinase